MTGAGAETSTHAALNGGKTGASDGAVRVGAALGIVVFAVGSLPLMSVENAALPLGLLWFCLFAGSVLIGTTIVRCLAARWDRRHARHQSELKATRRKMKQDQLDAFMKSERSAGHE